VIAPSATWLGLMTHMAQRCGSSNPDQPSQGLAGSADIACTRHAVGVLQGVDELLEADAVGGELRRVGLDGVLLDVTPQHVDAGDAFDGPQLRPDDPVLDRAELRRLYPKPAHADALGEGALTEAQRLTAVPDESPQLGWCGNVHLARPCQRTLTSSAESEGLQPGLLAVTYIATARYENMRRNSEL